MNERIRQLKEQAWTLVSNEERDRGELYEAREQWERCDQKFAELIVQECAEKAYAGVGPDSLDAYDRGWQNGRNSAAQVIKEHFGVEE